MIRKGVNLGDSLLELENIMQSHYTMWLILYKYIKKTTLGAFFNIMHSSKPALFTATSIINIKLNYHLSDDVNINWKYISFVKVEFMAKLLDWIAQAADQQLVVKYRNTEIQKVNSGKKTTVLDVKMFLFKFQNITFCF